MTLKNHLVADALIEKPRTFSELLNLIKIDKKHLKSILEYYVFYDIYEFDNETKKYKIHLDQTCSAPSSEFKNKFPNEKVVREIYESTLELFKMKKRQFVPKREDYSFTRTSVEPIYTLDDLTVDYEEKANKLIQLLKNLISKYANYPKFIKYCEILLGQSYLLIGDANSARKHLNIPETLTPFKISNKHKIIQFEQTSPDANLLISIGNNFYTDFAKKYKNEFLVEINKVIFSIESKEGRLFDKWEKLNEKKYAEKGINIGTESIKILSAFTFAKYLQEPLNLSLIVKRKWKKKNMFYCGKIVAEIKVILRLAENNLRIKNGLPKVGEGWVSETELYNFIKKEFPNYKVIHNYTANWLGKQHLDIFIQDLNLGIEFQGEQHFKPIKRFGGEEKFKENLKRDAIKKEKCKKNNICLIEVTKDYAEDDLIKKIKELL